MQESDSFFYVPFFETIELNLTRSLYLGIFYLENERCDGEPSAIAHLILFFEEGNAIIKIDDLMTSLGLANFLSSLRFYHIRANMKVRTFDRKNVTFFANQFRIICVTVFCIVINEGLGY